MSEIAIQAAGIGKQFRIGLQQRLYRTVRETLTDLMAAPFRRPIGAASSLFWALQDVTFDVRRGQTIGVLGPNGAGKSTLLKILSRITEPTTGSVEIRGRLSSLLEVGTGFHPELSGRENIFLNGAILGMRRAEITRKFDEIVAFAEVERFIDTAAKHYSSGMYLRLAFAVAAHLETEILLVDEVLAVGDAQFQKKCLGKMGEVARQGRTVLFVSHNMPAVQGMCERAIWLDQGRVREDGPSGDVISNYLRTATSSQTVRAWEDPDAGPGNDQVRLSRVCVRPETGGSEDPIDIRTPFLFEFDFWNFQEGANLNLRLYLYNEQGTLVFSTFPLSAAGWSGRPFPVGLYRGTCHVPGDLLNDGIHRATLLIRNGGEIAYKHDDALVFDVLDSPESRAGWHGKWIGSVRPRLSWEISRVEGAADRSNPEEIGADQELAR